MVATARLATVDRRLIYLFMGSLVLVSHFLPLGLPIAISGQVTRVCGGRRTTRPLGRGRFPGV